MFERLIAGDIEPVEYHENAVLTKSGAQRILAFHNAVIRNQASQITGILFSGEDITERKQAEEELRKSEERFKLIFENAPDAFYLNDLKGIFIEGNKAAAKITGFEREELIGSSFLKLNLLSLDQLPKAATLLAHNARGKPTGPDEFILKRKAGDKVPVEITTHPVKFEKRALVLGIARDITERKQAEKALQEKEEKYRSIFENVQDVYYETSFDGTVLEVSPSIEFISKGQYHRKDLIGRSMYEFYADVQNRDAVIAAIQKAGRVLDYEVTLKNRDNSLIPCSISAKIQFNVQGNPEKIIGSMHDITERKLAEVKLQASREAERDFAERLTILSEVTTELSKTESLDALCRRAVELGRERLDFDRIAIWFLAEDRTTMLGTFGVDTEGRYTDERDQQFPVGSDYPSQPVVQGEVPLLRLTDTPLALKGQNVGQGMHVSAGLWDGKDVIGYLSIDNLLRQRPISDQDCEIIRLYASAVGHLVSLQRAQKEIHASEERFEKSFQSSPIATIINILPEGRILDVNDTFLRITGYSREEVIGKTGLELGIWADPEEHIRLAAAMIAQESMRDVEGRVLTKSGESRDMLASVETIQIANQPHGLIMLNDITERKRAEEELAQQAEELRRSNEELARLYRASGSLISGASLNLQELAQKIVEIVQRDFGQANCSLLVVQKDSNELVRLTAAGPYADQVKYQNLTLDGPGLVPLSIRMNKVVNVGDVHSSPDYVKGWDEAQSEMVIPLKIGNDVIGVLDVQSSEPNAFSPDDERPMTVFAERAALALEHGRLNAQTDARLQQLTALRTVDMAISSSFDLNLTLGILLDQLKEQLGVHATDILVFNATMQTFRFACERGFRTQMLHRTQFKFGAGYAWQAIRERRLINIPDIQAGPDGLQRSPNLSSEQFVAYLGVPLIAKGEIQGVLEVFHREPLVLEKEGVGFLEMLAGQAAIAINNAELFDRLQISNTDLTMAYDSTLEGWASALELRDKATEGHTRRVTEMTMQLARALGVKENELVHVYRGAVLHEMGGPDHIMLKPGPLTEDEWIIMRKHPQYAYDMLSPIIYLRQALDIPYCHHEKWDGTGYPRGLKGEQIPFAARIFSVVDVWDALTSDRPYRQAWPEEKARQYIQEQEGLHFDPQVVRAFLKENFKKG